MKQRSRLHLSEFAPIAMRLAAAQTALALAAFCSSSAAHSLARRSADVFGNSRFYYSSLEADASFVAGRAFTAVLTTSAASVSWCSISQNCVFSSGSDTPSSNYTTAASSVSVTCSSAGIEKFTVLRNNDASTTDTFFIAIAPSVRFQWQAAAGLSPVGVLPAYASAASIRIWVADPSTLSADESAGTAAAPSAASAQLTAGFASIGEWPSVSISGVSILNATFNSVLSLWQIYVATDMPAAAVASISSQNTTLLGGSVANAAKIVSIAKFSSTTLGLATPLSLTPGSTSYFSVVQDACSPNVVVSISNLYGDGNFVLTNTLFSGTETLSITSFPSAISPGATIRGIAFPINGIVAIVNGESVYANSSSALKSSAGLPSGIQPTRIRAASTCDFSLKRSSALNAFVVMWDHTALSTPSSPNVTFYLSSDNGANFKSMTVNVDKTSVGGGYIRDVAIMHTYATISILIHDGAGYDRIGIFDISKSTVTTDGFQFDPNATPSFVVDGGSKGSSPKLTPSGLGAGELFIWGDSLFFSPNGGISVLSVTLSSRDPARPTAGLATNEYISNFVTAPNGRFAALTSTNRVFYGQAGLSSAIELVAGIPQGNPASLLFDSLNKLIVVTPQSSSPFIQRRIIPAENQIMSPRVPYAANPNQTCPFISWNTNMSTEYILDSNQTLLLSSSVIPLYSNASASVSIAFSNLSLIDATTNISNVWQASASGVMRIQNTNLSIKPKSLKAQGRVDIKLVPSDTNLVCPAQPQVAVVRVGCPPSRQLVFRRPIPYVPPASPTPRYDWSTRYIQSSIDNGLMTPTPTINYASTAKPTLATSTDCSLAPTSISVPAGAWISDWATTSFGTSVLTVNYNCTKFGIPLDIYYGDFFKPVFDIFDGTTYITTPDVDIALWEYNGRTSFTYNMSMLMAGCLTRAQSWISLASTMPNSPVDALTPQNYIKCYNPPQPYTPLASSDIYLPYPILNMTNKNSIMWTTGLGGYYLFRAKVVDPDYSYCELTADFAIHIVGEPLYWGYQIAILVGAMIVVIGMLWVSYEMYARKQRMEREENGRQDDDGAGIKLDKTGSKASLGSKRFKEKME